MALFNFRKNADLNNTAAASAEPVESVEVLRKKTLHRLIGSAILVLAAIVVFSLVFDRQPRPIPVDIAISIPSRDAQTPLVIGAPLVTASAPVAAMPAAAPVSDAAAPAAASSAPIAPTAPVPASASARVPVKASLGAKEELVAPAAKPAAPASASAKEVAKPPVKEAPKEAPKEPPKDAGADKSKAEAERAKALLEGKAVPAPEKAASAEAGRFIVQVGAFADPVKARQTRLKVEKAGMKTYTHVAETAEGKRIRVRVGPFASRDEAEKAAKKLKSLDLPAAILTL